MKRVLILEKEWCDQEILHRAVNSCRKEVLIYRCENVEAACEVLKSVKMDLFILAVESEGKTDIKGLEFGMFLRKQEDYFFTPIICISNHKDYKIYAYEKLHCYYYCTKPIDQKYLKMILYDILNYRGPCYGEPKVEYYMKGILQQIYMKDIVYVESMERKLLVHTVNEIVVIPYILLKEFAKKLDPSIILQCHRSYIVNIHFIKRVNHGENSLSLSVDNLKIPLGLRFKKEIMEMLRRKRLK